MAIGRKTGGRKAGTPNKKTLNLIEALGSYNPLTALIKIANNSETPLDIQIKINLDLLPYIYPKRKNIDIDCCHFEEKSERNIQEEIEDIKAMRRLLDECG